MTRTIRPNELAEHWEGLESPEQREYRSRGLDVFASGGEALISLDASGLRRVLIPIASKREAREDKSSRGVHLTTHPLQDTDGRTRLYLDLECRLPHLTELFAVIAAEVLTLIVEDSREPGGTIIRVLGRWRELIGSERGRVLGPESVAGLVGELLFLRTILQEGAGGLASWLGPDGAPKDFTEPGWQVEVKTLLRGSRRRVQINGLAQLELPENAPLSLVVYSLTRSAEGALKLPELVDEILELGVDRAVFLGKLGEVGYDIGDREAYSSLRFTVEEAVFFRVESEFPRLTSASLRESVPDEVSAVSYYLDLSSLEPGGEVLDLVGGLAV